MEFSLRSRTFAAEFKRFKVQNSKGSLVGVGNLYTIVTLKPLNINLWLVS
jgi:hypothetical protein